MLIDSAYAGGRVKLDIVDSEKVGVASSEGEQRALALAIFMAEVALVLVQVIVFTHDLAFANDLAEETTRDWLWPYC